MIAHASINVGDYAKAKEFYTRVLKALGYTQNIEYGESAGFNDGKNTDFWIAQSAKLVPSHIAFESKSTEEVQEFYSVACAAGAKDNGAPGYRTEYWPGYYAVFVFDADGNNIEAVWFDYTKAAEN